MLYKRSDSKFWWCEFIAANGKRVQRSTKTVDKRLTQEFEDKFKVELWRVYQLGERPRYTWKEAVIQWCRESSHLKSMNSVKAHLEFADRYLGNLYLDEIKRPLLEQMISDKLATGVQNATVNRLMEVVRTILNKSVKEWDWLDKAPHIRMLKEPKIRIRFLTPEEAQHLFIELPEHLEMMCRFSLATGLRASNVTGLKWSHIDLNRRMGLIDAQDFKSARNFSFPLNNEAMAVLRRQQGKHPNFVFTFDGKPVKQVNTKAWRNALKRAGIENFRWHDLRHTWASWHIQNGTPIEMLKELGGWSDIRMVLRYAHLSTEHLMKYASNISGLRVVETTYSPTVANNF